MLTPSSATARLGRRCAGVLMSGVLGGAFLSHADTTESAVALHMAARDGNVIEMHRLIESGVEIDAMSPAGAMDRYSGTPLHFAAKHGQVEAIELLYANGAELEARVVPYRYTALHLAARAGRLNAVEA